MNHFVDNFQFIRPEYLLALIPLLIGYALKLTYAKDQNLWQQIIPQHLYQKMVISKGIRQSNRFMHVAMFGLIVAIIAIAGPSWEKLPQAVYQTQAGKVILIDMSLSMRSSDLSPNRLTRARFKAIDLLNQVKEGETGLIAYAGDAFVVSPLTDDANTLKTLIPVLSPEIMPTQGSYALLGLMRASELLANAGYQTGQIYWVTDGIRYDEIREVRDFIQQSAYDISALLVGTEQGAPIQLDDGQLLKDSTGKIVVPSINSRYMDQAMLGTNASYELFASDNSDIQSMKRKVTFTQQEQAQAMENTAGDSLKDMGPYLVLLLLPIAAYGFRKGVLSIVLISALTGSYIFSPTLAIAQENSASGAPDTNNPSITLANPSAQPEGILDRIFKNTDQRGKQAFENKNFEKANELFEDPTWKAASAYKLGEYETAAALYDELDGVENIYNRGNALAKTGKLQEALEAYNKVLEIDSENEQAAKNKQIIEQMLEQQPQDQEQQGDDSQSQDQNSEQDKEQDKEQDQQQDGADGENKEDQQQENKPDSDASENDEQDQSQQQDDQSQSQQDGDQSQQNDPQTSGSDQALQDAANQQAEQNDADNQEPAKPNDEPSENSPAESQPPQSESDKPNNEQQQAAISNQTDMSELTPEEQEEMQRMQMILNKVPDDPAYLLKRKMLLEAYKRKGTPPPPPTEENW